MMSTILCSRYRRYDESSHFNGIVSAQETPLIFLDYKIADVLLATVVAVMPFCALLDNFVFHGLTIAGLSACNFLLSATLLASVLFNIAGSKSRGGQFLLASILLFVTMLAKMVFQPLGDLATWLSGHEYYLLVPLFAFCSANVSAHHAPDLIAILITSALPVCFLSLYFFLTNDYLGMVPYEIMLAYDVVGMPFARMMGTFGSPNVAGAYFAIVLFLDLQRATASKGMALFRRGLLAICLLLTFSRMAIMSFLVTELVFFLKRKKTLTGKAGFNAARVLIAMAGALVILALFASLSRRGLYFFDFTNEDATNNLRFSKWAAFLHEGANAVLLGEPIGSSYTYNGLTLSDNSFLCSIASFGLLVALSYWALLFLGFNNSREGGSVIAPLLMVLVFLVLSDFIQLFPGCYCAVLLLLIPSKGHLTEGSL